MRFRLWLEASPSRVKFYHWTDISALPSIQAKGIVPRSARQNEFGDEPSAVWILRNDKYFASGPNSGVKQPILLQGWLDSSELDALGLVDADHMDRLGGSPMYKSLPPEDDNTDGRDWRKTFYYQGKKRDPYRGYGAAGYQGVIPFSQIENIKYGRKWFSVSDFLNKYKNEVNKGSSERNLTLFRQIFDSSQLFSVQAYFDKAKELFPSIQSLLSDEERDAYEGILNMLSRRYSKLQ